MAQWVNWLSAYHLMKSLRHSMPFRPRMHWAARAPNHQGRARNVTLTEWESELLFDVQARQLKLFRLKAGRIEADKPRLKPLVDQLLPGLIAVDLSRAMLLCGSRSDMSLRMKENS